MHGRQSGHICGIQILSAWLLSESETVVYVSELECIPLCRRQTGSECRDSSGFSVFSHDRTSPLQGHPGMNNQKWLHAGPGLV